MKNCHIQKYLWLNKKKLGTKVIARLDCRAFSRPTIQHVKCFPLLPESCDSDRCEQCITYRKTLAKAASRKATTQTSAHSHTNHRYLTSPQEIARIRELQHTNRVCQKRIEQLSKKIEELTSRNGVCLDDDISADLKEIVKQEDKGQYFIHNIVGKWVIYLSLWISLLPHIYCMHIVNHCHCHSKSTFAPPSKL